MASDIEDVDLSGRPAQARFCNFPTGKSDTLPAHEQWVKAVLKSLLDGNPGAWIDLIGFASKLGFAAGGSAQKNRDLSEARFNSVKRLIKRYVPGARFNVSLPEGDTQSSGGAKDDDGYWRAVKIKVFGVTQPIPPPGPGPPPPPAASAALTFTIDLFGWIPQSEVDNPLSLLPSIVKSLLPPGMADPFFGGDNFAVPTGTFAGMSGRTFRAKQHLEFAVPKWGDPPTGVGTSVDSGITTCLDNRRAAGGKVTFSLKATIFRSAAAVAFSASDDWYEATICGVVLDPVPAAAVTALTAKISSIPPILRSEVLRIVSRLAGKATPSLTWDATVRVQRSSTLAPLTELSYRAFTGKEESSTLPCASGALRSGSGLVHGKVTFSQWPSAVVYLNLGAAGGGSFEQPVMFASGARVPRPEPAFIVIPSLVKVRQVTW